MPDIGQLILSGAYSPWVYLPFAVLLGALHALEPGHSKSLMAGFIIAIRGTPAQATLLGLSTAVGHTLIVWLLAIIGLSIGDKLILDRAEPWITLISGLLVIGLAWRLFRSTPATLDLHTPAPEAVARVHDHGHHGAHDHGYAGSHSHAHDGGHAAAHERDIQTRFAGRTSVSAWEVIWFGFTGGLMPCPSALAVLLIYLQSGAFVLGMSMVAAFSVGLAISLVSVGVIAIWGASRASARWPAIEHLLGRLPLVSAVLVFAIGIYMVISGLMHIL
jgi:nickel/cobalt transporter (NicO) family protein